jgi:signal recognition particle subunit SRP68
LTSAQRSAKRRGQTVAVFSSADKAIVADNAAGSSKVRTELDGYDGLLAALTEAEEVARRLVKDNAEALSKSHSGRYEATSTTLANVHEYVLFKLLATRIERNAALISEVQEKSAKRQARTREYVEGRINALTTSNGKKARAEGKEPVRRRAKPSSKKVRPPTARKVRQKRATSTKRRIGNTSSSRVRPAEQRLRSRGEQKIRRIAVRTIPGSARLLDANEAGCETMSGLSVVEADSDLSTLIEAKSAWYKAEMLRMLARSFAASDEHAKGLVLLNRAELFVREAQSAMELVNSEAVHEEDSTLLPPRMDETTFSHTSDEIARIRRQIQRDFYVKQQGTSAAKTVEISNKKAGASQSKAAQAVRDLASKYVAFDPVDLRQAAVIPDDIIQDVSSTSLPASRRPSAVPKSKAGVPAPIAVPAAPAAPAAPTSPASPDDAEGEAAFVEAESMPSPDEDHMSDAEDDAEFADASAKDVDGDGAYDPGNMLAEEEEREAADAAAKKGRWLGGWFARN